MGLIGLVLFAVGVWFLVHHLTDLARWGLERVFPGARVEIRQVDYVFPDQIVIEALRLRARDGGEELLSLAKGRLRFDFDDLRQLRIGEVRLEEPVLRVSPRLPEAFASSESTGGSPGKSRPWIVRRLVCDYGEIAVSGYGRGDVAVRTKFAFDWENFSPARRDPQQLTLWDMVGTSGSEMVLSLDLVTLGFVPAEVFGSRHLRDVTVAGGSLAVGNALREMFSGPPEPATSGGESPFVIGKLDLQRLHVRVNDDQPVLADIRFAVNLVLKNVPLSQAAGELGAEEQTIEVSNLVIPSPLDPLTRVFMLESLFVRFSLAGLLRREISDMTILGPAIFVGEDLFWYMNAAQKELGSGGADGGPGWTIRSLKVDYGRLILGSGGRRQFGLPLNFRTTAENVSLDHLAALKLHAVLDVPPQKYAFASYQLEFTTRQGQLRFSYPPEDSPDNLVGSIRLDGIRWRQFRAEEGWVSVTFDRKGINGTFGANIFGGETTGGFSFVFGAGTPWAGWLSGGKFDLKKLTDVLAPENVRLTGPLEFRTQVRARGKEIDEVTGEGVMTRPGRLTLTKLDELLAKIPENWAGFKKDGTRILLETLRDFEYTEGTGSFDYTGGKGNVRLQLQGPSGSRTFQIVLHPENP